MEEQNQKETIDLSDALRRRSDELKPKPPIFRGIDSNTPKIIRWMVMHIQGA